MNFFGHIFISSPGLGEGGRHVFLPVAKILDFSCHFVNEFLGSQNQRHLLIFGRKLKLDYKNNVFAM